MAKRFIDTQLFDDPWFMDLSKDSKIFWIYCITKCNHAGIIELNERLFKFQTGLKCLVTVIKELGNRLIRVRDQYYFIPKFLDFQYPNFPNSKVKSQKSAMDILLKFNIDIDNMQTLREPLDKSYETEYDNGIDNDNGSEKEKAYRKFKHLSISIDEFEKLKSKGYSQVLIDATLDNIENFKNNKKYNSLYLTANNWLKKESENTKEDYDYNQDVLS